MQRALRSLIVLGEKMGYQCAGEQPLLWKAGETTAYRFYFSPLAQISLFADSSAQEGIQSVLVLPGSRSALLNFKLMRDPHLRELTAHGWHFLKLRTVKALSAYSGLTRALWEMQLDSDPVLLEETTQLRIFG